MAYLYAIEFTTRAIKVGRCDGDVRDRVQMHRNDASRFGVDILRSHISDPCLSGSDRAECLVLEKCREAASVTTASEWFRGLDFWQVVSWIDEAASQPESAPLTPSVYDMTKQLLRSGMSRKALAVDADISIGTVALIVHGRPQARRAWRTVDRIRSVWLRRFGESPDSARAA